tara:strand:- start:7746 stop:8303 length:558 start_codon:yes stop_codon:yes gene_type:complete
MNLERFVKIVGYDILKFPLLVSSWQSVGEGAPSGVGNFKLTERITMEQSKQLRLNYTDFLGRYSQDSLAEFDGFVTKYGKEGWYIGFTGTLRGWESRKLLPTLHYAQKIVDTEEMKALIGRPELPVWEFFVFNPYKMGINYWFNTWQRVMPMSGDEVGAYIGETLDLSQFDFINWQFQTPFEVEK